MRDVIGSAPSTVSSVQESSPPVRTDDSTESPTSTGNVALTVLAVAAVIVLLRYMAAVVIPLVIGGLLFYALDPVVDRLERWRIPRAFAAMVVLLTVVMGTGALAYSLLDETMAVVQELPVAAQKLRSSLRSYRNQSTSTLERVQQAAQELEKAAKESAGTAPVRGVTRVQIEGPSFAANYLWSGSLGVLSLVGQTVLILFLTYFLLLSDDLFKRKLVEVAGPTLTHKRITVKILEEIADQIERFLLVQVFTSAVVGLVTWLTLWWMGLNYAPLWGLFAGVLNSIPYFGPLIVTSTLFLIAFLQFGTLGMAAAVGGLALTITTLEGWLLTPVLMSRVSQMNQVTVFAGLLFWGWMWGIPGLLLAVPMMMVIKATCDRIEDLQPIGKLLGS